MNDKNLILGTRKWHIYATIDYNNNNNNNVYKHNDNNNKNDTTTTIVGWFNILYYYNMIFAVLHKYQWYTFS